jgi:hypothetical protein
MKKILLLPLVFALLSCGKHDFNDALEDIASEILGELRTGWLASEENFSAIPQDVMFFSGDASDLPPAVSLENKFPPIGDQGQYGTCVAWAVGYNLKTALNGIEKNWSSSDLARTANQTSPKDLWMAIPASRKGSNCGGTSFEAALEALISKGGASLTDVPYSNMGSCSGTSNGNANNKLANYRKIGMELSSIKGYLSQGRPIVIGAQLGDRFMRWNSSAVISSDTYNDPNMQHANHAMVLAGYDDSKNAFRVINSWGTSWGDRGSIWVDYDFFFDYFCFAAFIAQNPNDEPLQPESSGYDLLVSFAEDFTDPEGANARDRGFSYDIFNNGSLPILARQKWTVIYMYYNAYNANEYEIIFEDYYTNEYGNLGDYGKYAETDALVGGLWNNVNVEPGKKAGEAEFGDEGFYIPYTMPSITGDYYLVAYADAYDRILESNEDNNFYFITAENGKPLKFSNGVMQSTPADFAASSNVLGKKLGRAALASSVAKLGELNGYTPREIKFLLKQSKKNGEMAKKIMEFRRNSPAPAKIPRRR